MDVAWVSCISLPESDPDQVEGLAALRDRGHSVEVVAWDNPSVRWNQFHLCVLRSPWNYPHLPGPFRAWLEARRRTRLWNPAAVALWNLDKTYLQQAEAAGVPIVPTAFGDRGNSVATLAAARGWSEVVVKPTIGAGSIGVRKYSSPELAERHAAELGPFMVQPFLPAFAKERSIVWVDGHFTHVVEKQPRLSGEHEQVSLAGRPSDAEIAFARKALGLAPGPLLYGRVDVVYTDTGLALSELELIEPSLFWSLGGIATESLVAFVEGIEHRHAEMR